MKFCNQYSCGYNPIQENNDTNKTKFRGLKPINPQEKLNIKLSLQSLDEQVDILIFIPGTANIIPYEQHHACKAS